MPVEEIGGGVDRHVHDIADGFSVVENLEGLRIVARSMAIFALHVAGGKKVHLQLDLAVSVAGLAASALGVERDFTPTTREVREAQVPGRSLGGICQVKFRLCSAGHPSTNQPEEEENQPASQSTPQQTFNNSIIGIFNNSIIQ